MQNSKLLKHSLALTWHKNIVLIKCAMKRNHDDENYCTRLKDMSLYIFRILGNRWNFQECNSRIDIKNASNEPMFITRHIFIIANISFSAWITCYKAKNVKHLHNLLYFHQQHRGGNDESH